MYTKATLVARPTTPAPKKYSQTGRPDGALPFVWSITLVTRSNANTDRIRSDVGCLRGDPAAELGEEGDERGAEAEAHDQERRVLRGRAAAEAAEQAEDPVAADQ